MSLLQTIAAIRGAPVIPPPPVDPPPATDYPGLVLSHAPTHYWRMATNGADLGSSPVTLSAVGGLAYSRPPLVEDDASGGSASFGGGHAVAGGALDGFGVGTIAFTFQIDAPPTTGQRQDLLSVRDEAFPFGGDAMAFRLMESGGGWLVDIYRSYLGGAGIWVRRSNPSVITAAVPQQVAVGFGSAGQISLWINGSPATLNNVSGAQPGSWAGFGSSQTFLGSFQGTAVPFDGLMSEVATFNTLLSDAAVAAIHGADTRRAQAVYLDNSGLALGDVSAGETFDPKLLTTTHPTSGITCTVDTPPATGSVTGGSVFTFATIGGDGVGFSFTGHISKSSVPSTVRTITGTWESVVVADFMVPRTDVWLTNDDQDPATLGATQRFSAPGAPTGGSGLSAGSPRDLATLLSVASAGHVIRLAQGYYSMPDGLTIPSGASASNPVTVVAEQGSWAVICQDINALKAPNIDAGTGRPTADTWTLWDATHNIWRMPYTASSGGEVQGCWFEGGIAHLLLRYPNVAAMQNSNGGDLGGDVRDSVNTPQTRSHYWGPGLAVDGSFVYIRFDRPNWRDVGFVHSTYGAWPDDDRWTLGVEGQTTPRKWLTRSSAGDFRTGRPCLPNPLNETPTISGNLPSGRNPNNARIYFARAFDRSLINGASGSFIRIGSGVNSHGFKQIISGARNSAEFHRGVDWLTYYAMVATGTIQNITFHRRRFVHAWWRLLASMAAYKFNNFLSPPSQAWDSYSQWFMFGGSGSSYINVTFDNCLIEGFHEIAVGAGTWNKVRFVQSCIAFMQEEFMQISPLLSQVEVGFCYFRDSPLGWSTEEPGRTGTQSPFSSFWVHHNICDNRCGRGSFDSDRPINGGCNNVSRNISVNSAWKFYNNTVIQGPDTAGQFWLGFGNQGNHEVTQAGGVAANFTEVFNNILVRQDFKRYWAIEGGYSFRLADGIEEGLILQSSNEEYRDYNCYSRHGLPQKSGGGYNGGKIRITNEHFGSGARADFAYFRSQPAGEPSGSIFFGSGAGLHGVTKSRPGTTTGWDAESSDVNPQIPSCTSMANRMNYRPTAAHITTARNGSLSGANWWTSPGWTSYGATPVPFNMAPSAWKGALDPAGSTMPVGVQNP